MPQSTDFESFKPAFFALFTSPTFRSADFLTYLARSERDRRNDEASVVDSGIVGRLLELLGFLGAAQNYNQAKEGQRPDFAPFAAGYGTCFIVEDKNTTLDLTRNLTDPTSNLSQLAGYLRSQGLRLGWLTNGRLLTAWRFDSFEQPTCLIELDIIQAVQEWQTGNLSIQTEEKLQLLFNQFRREVFSSTEFLIAEIAVDLAYWQTHALPLGEGRNETQLVESLKTLVEDLHAEAKRQLHEFFAAFQRYTAAIEFLPTDSTQPAVELLLENRNRIIEAFKAMKSTLGLENAEITEIEQVLEKVQSGTRLYNSLKKVEAALLEIVNVAKARKYGGNTRAGAPFLSLDALNGGLANQLKAFVEKALSYQQHLALLRQTYGDALNVYDNYLLWEALVQETMLGELSEEQRKSEFALQAAYVVFIRLLLIRVCEDKGIFADRFVSDGGIKHWQEDIQRYLKFATGNPYSFLLDMAYQNAQNIYAHFFTGRDLFNWFKLDQAAFILALRHLNRFNFANVDSDIIGTIYNTYVDREEKQKKGQYYTPVAIVDYILDEVGYKPGPAIVGSNKKLIDPACGSGTFLVRAARRLVQTYRNQPGADPVQILEQVRDNLYGFEINPFACYLAEVNLLIQTLDVVRDALNSGQLPRLPRFHIYNVDTLARPTGTYYSAQLNTLLAEETDQVDRIKRRVDSYTPGFAFVVANPPYGARLSDLYKRRLEEEWSEVFYGQPDTFVFFLKFATSLLSRSGKMGFITPNTYLMGTNTHKLRAELLKAGRIEQIVDLPKGIWRDATVDCVLLFLATESDETARRAQPVTINVLGLRDSLEKLTAREWSEHLQQPQAAWLDHPQFEMNIKNDPLLQKIEAACLVSTGVILEDGLPQTKVLRLGDVADSSQGIIVYGTKAQSSVNPYIKPKAALRSPDQSWKKFLEGGLVGRYEIRPDSQSFYLQYSQNLHRPRESRFFESPKLILVRQMNRAIARRLAAAYDEQKYYVKDNYSTIIQKDSKYNLKYLLSLINSSVLNYWYIRRFVNVNINPVYFRQLPIYPATAEQQAGLVAQVDALLTAHEKLNQWRAQGYLIRRQANGQATIKIPYTLLLQEIQQADRDFPILTLFQATAAGLVTLPPAANLSATVSSNIFVPPRYPNSLVLRHNQLWLEITNEKVRCYLLNYLAQPRWQNQTWQNKLSADVLLPENEGAFDTLFALEATRRAEVEALLAEIAQLDNAIDLAVLDLYGISDPAERQRILQTAPALADEDEVSETDVASEDE